MLLVAFSYLKLSFCRTIIVSVWLSVAFMLSSSPPAPHPFVQGPPDRCKSQFGEGSAKSSPDISCFSYSLIKLNLGLLSPLFYQENFVKGGGVCIKVIASLSVLKLLTFFKCRLFELLKHYYDLRRVCRSYRRETGRFQFLPKL